MNTHIFRPALASLVIASMLFAGTFAPAKAATTSTIRDILIGAAALAAVATAYNVAHKQQLARTVEGYLPDGSVVYQDGHVVSSNGISWYPGNSGDQVACSNQQCEISGQNNGYGYNGSSGYNRAPYAATTAYTQPGAGAAVADTVTKRARS